MPLNRDYCDFNIDLQQNYFVFYIFIINNAKIRSVVICIVKIECLFLSIKSLLRPISFV